MKLKTFFLAFTLFFSFSVLAQECGTKLMPNYKTLRQQYLQLSAASSTLLPHDTCLNKKLSIVFYVFLDSTYTPGVTATQYTQCISILNKYFKPICIEFMNCSTVFVPEHEYNKWDRTAHEGKVVGTYNWFTDKTINIYLVDNIVVPAGRNGYAHMPGGRDLIVMKKSAFTGMTAVHEMGHFFGLPHTFAEISTNSEDGPSIELVNGSNCQTTGDGFCDTDADPYSIGSGVAPCGFVYGPKDANNQYYVPPVDNIMSYWQCRCRFTIEQYNWMAYMYLTQRNYLH
jgi:hypothetical protein